MVHATRFVQISGGVYIQQHAWVIHDHRVGGIPCNQTFSTIVTRE
jgi:hypothetical protein